MPELHGVRVLCVDDHAINRTLLEALLSTWGMQVDCTENGPSALTQLRRAQRQGRGYDVAILDLQMPGVDGLTLARAIKADPTLTSVRLLLMTSVGFRGHGTGAQDAGIAASLTKPVRHSHLYNGLMTVMGLAVATTSPPLLPRHRLAEGGTQARGRVLLAEDNIVNQHVATGMFKTLGCRVDVVANGYEVLEAQTDRHVPIIALTANAMQSDREHCLEAGMDDFLTKPIRRAALAETLSRWLPAPHAEEETPQGPGDAEDPREVSCAHASP